ncbi:MAG: hypothetical protein GF330_07085 [Candidatus Eisenbacteria bacterium]|nr:hypothetical protein [Candidatus Eisenbacteria bacterium]
MADAELGSKFLGDPILTSLGMIARDALDEGDVPAGDARSAAPPASRSASPERPEALAVPSQYGIRLHDDEGPGPVGPKPAEEDPEDAILGPKSGTLLSSLVDSQLLTQSGILQGQHGSGHQGRA